jgi:hypothetical protein
LAKRVWSKNFLPTTKPIFEGGWSTGFQTFL